MSNTVIGSARFYFSTLTSTNRFAIQLLSKTRPRAGTVISADFQTRGEGQYGRSWFGTKGKNLYVSVILYPRLEASQQFRVSALAALASRETIATLCNKSAKIKWPNDIYVADRKIAGILIRNSITGQNIRHSIIGIGMNVNETAFPDHLPNPGSIKSVTGEKVELSEVRELLIANLNEHLNRVMTSDISYVGKAYDEHLYMIGKKARYEVMDDKSPQEGVISGIDNFGRLGIKQGNSLKYYALNQIRLLK